MLYNPERFAGDYHRAISVGVATGNRPEILPTPPRQPKRRSTANKATQHFDF
jgi:hypothetical protein